MTCPSDPRATRRRTGFSLLEMLVVLTILALASGLVSMRMGAGQSCSVIERDARAVLSVLTEARLRATERGRSVTVLLDPVAGRLTVVPDGPHKALVSGTITGPLRTVFWPEGGASGARYVLSNGATTRFVTVEAFSGAVAVTQSAP